MIKVVLLSAIFLFSCCFAQPNSVYVSGCISFGIQNGEQTYGTFTQTFSPQTWTSQLTVNAYTGSSCSPFTKLLSYTTTATFTVGAVATVGNPQINGVSAYLITYNITSNTITPASDLIAGTLAGLCETSDIFGSGNATDVSLHGCIGLGLLPVSICGVQAGVVQYNSTNLFLGALNVTAACAGVAPVFLNPAPLNVQVVSSLQTGAFVSPCVAITDNGITLYEVYTFTTSLVSPYSTLTSNTYYDAACSQLAIVTVVAFNATVTGAGIVSGAIPGAIPASTTALSVISVKVTPFSANGLGLLQLACGNYDWVQSSTLDITTDGCTGIGFAPLAYCPALYTTFQVSADSTTLYFGNFLGQCTSTATQIIPLPYVYNDGTSSLVPGIFQAGCTPFQSYYNKNTLTVDTVNYQLSLLTYTYADAACTDLISFTVMNGEFDIETGATSANPIPTGTLLAAFGVSFDDSSVITMTPISQTIAEGLHAACPSATFSAGNATNLLGVGCPELGFPDCDELYFAIQLSADGLSYYLSQPVWCNDATTGYTMVNTAFAPYTPTILSGTFTASCSPFSAGGINVYNSYQVALTSTTATTGTYTVTTMTYESAGCSSLESTTTLSATYSIDNQAVANNPVISASPVTGINYLYTAKTVTPATATFAIIAGSICANGLTFTQGQATDVLAAGCVGLGIPPASVCPTTYNVFQVGSDSSSLYFGAANLTACSSSGRVNQMDQTKWSQQAATTPAPTGTTTPTPHSLASSLSSSLLFVVIAALFALFTKF